VVADVCVEDGAGVAGVPSLFFWPVLGVVDDCLVESVEELGVVEVEAGGDLLYDVDGELGFCFGEFVDGLLECFGHFCFLLCFICVFC